MLTIIIYVLAFAYGRMTDRLSWKPFAVLLGLAAIVAYLFPTQYPSNFAMDVGAYVAIPALLFTVGYLFGRWRGDRKSEDRYSD